MDDKPLSPFWLVAVGTLLATYMVAAVVGSWAVESGMNRDVVGWVSAYSVAAVFMAVAWAIIFRVELEKRKLSIRSLLALVMMQALGLWLVRVTHYVGRPW